MTTVDMYFKKNTAEALMKMAATESTAVDLENIIARLDQEKVGDPDTREELAKEITELIGRAKMIVFWED